jgi:cystathionine beta-synthase
MTARTLHRPAIVSQVSDLIGYTPLFELCRTETGSRLLLKLEQYNPTGTAKIRMARQMVLDAESRGQLRSNGRIIESTSDNHACADKLRGMKALGAELVYVVDDGDEELATAAREELAEQLARGADNTIFTEQHNNPSNAIGYYDLARELIDALDGRIDQLIGAVGTGGSLCGTALELHRRIGAITVIGVEPVGSIAFGAPGGEYYQSGTGTPPGVETGALVDFDLIDDGVNVSDIDAFATARVVAARTGLLIGGSAGGVVFEALRRLPFSAPGITMVALVCDGGEKYLDTVFNDEWMSARNLIDAEAEHEVDELLRKLRGI